ncbi:hypothetical protein [Bradyrhizobium retamae]|uniref:Uncharacterized protein n=1 Tax=Bradyrhizobium retamae TaxID=1300035 RepID=A0A0R3N1J0_9BRAD|nr:hypothetical protein [Bradyrhizobium retamae]KRR25937.1 hypothetical protein CQ13_23215 [Bradyrhizobium retamae]
MTPFVSQILLALGPYVVPVFILIFAALLCLAMWLLDKPGVWRVSMACLILAGLALQLAPLVLP